MKWKSTRVVSIPGSPCPCNSMEFLFYLIGGSHPLFKMQVQNRQMLLNNSDKLPASVLTVSTHIVASWMGCRHKLKPPVWSLAQMRSCTHIYNGTVLSRTMLFVNFLPGPYTILKHATSNVWCVHAGYSGGLVELFRHPPQHDVDDDLQFFRFTYISLLIFPIILPGNSFLLFNNTYD